MIKDVAVQRYKAALMTGAGCIVACTYVSILAMVSGSARLAYTLVHMRLRDQDEHSLRRIEV